MRHESVGRTVTVPDELFRRVESRLPRSEFDTVDEYATYVLSTVVAEVESETTTEGEHDEVERDEVEARLKSLGYLD